MLPSEVLTPLPADAGKQYFRKYQVRIWANFVTSPLMDELNLGQEIPKTVVRTAYTMGLRGSEGDGTRIRAGSDIEEK